MKYVLLIIAALALACERGRAEPPLDDNVDACKPACATLRDLGCPEGQPNLRGVSCERTCATALELRPLPLACWTGAKDAVTAKSCGSLRCVR